MNLQRIILDEKIKNPQKLHGDSLVVQMVKNLTAMWETWVQCTPQISIVIPTEVPHTGIPLIDQVNIALHWPPFKVGKD